MTVWMMCSSTPLKKEISAASILIVQKLFEGSFEVVDVIIFFSGCIETGTIVSFCCDIGKAPP
ncbi:hypothetical protein [Heyndrickxia sporothermodurans]|uniref:Uncharacterized protein n=1 Tax=Heyndrickxia sporothermodurans TaxID=46224 RepID=A0AB37HM25_9BACI|nr:hypothetical protein JGZ69_11900 [Heyndrickxia sporothermodurans]QQX23643.1 hypothetical protein JGZ69_11950 [Heyndrickxia sporothermodurans]QQX23649.1 hypothetical protein JGZ69_12015 [Heyndrickxia sporothermodurans]QQX23661.1 hypothetical protein JGZ69_12120 [Heyndrickxia sporothermodurans]QQX23671.1 hypothetical protein JGZ69_12190 [Heyndrickxia sporothermodurans]